MTVFLIIIGLVTSYVAGQDPIGCHVQGDITGIVLKSEHVVDYNECLQNCKQDPNCSVFTYDDDFKDCAHFLNATFLDDSCTTCISGNRDCQLYQASNCQIEGRCIGELVSVMPKTSEGECLQSCKQDDSCKW